MNAVNWFTNRHVVSALCAAPLLLSCAYASAEDVAPAVTEPTADHLAREHTATAAAEPVSPHTVTFNLGLYSEYMFRGVSLSDGPALQGGVDYAHSSGLYAGTWWSNIDKEFTGHGDGFSGGNSLETDWYAGYAHTFKNGIGVNVMGNYYYYPNRENSFSAGDVGDKQDTFEASIALSYKWFTYTYYNALTDYYGAAKDGTNDGTSDTSNATYNELKFNYTLPIADLNFLAKVGYQHTPNLTGSQGDLAIGLSRNFSLPSAGKPIEGFSAGAYYTDTFHVKNEAFYVTSDGRDTNREKLWFFVKRTW